MKKLLCVLAFFSVLAFKAQQGLYRHLPQTAPQFPLNGMPWTGNPQTPMLTADGGYLLKNWKLFMGFESAGGMGDGVIIKTDSSFIPQWKKNYPCAITLPTGGIILFGGSTIEKVTASGTHVWTKHLTTPIILSDAVVFGNKIRFVGNLRTSIYAPFTTHIVYFSDGFSILADTSGNYVSHTLLHSNIVSTINYVNYSFRGSAEFSKIKRDGQGNFFVYSNANSMSAIPSKMSIAKFDSSFNFIWGKRWGSNSQTTLINDIDILANGRIIASGATNGNTNYSWMYRSALFKLDKQGNLLSQCFFENRTGSSGLCKKTNGNYVLSLNANDSIFMLETDTSLNVLWHKFVARGSFVGGSVISHNILYTPFQNGLDLVLISNDMNGNSCASYSMSYTKPTSTITLIDFSLTPVTYTTAIVNGTINSIASQSYNDSCNCPVFIPIMQNTLCVGNTGTIAIIGTGNLSWYGTATGNSFLHSGSQFTFSSNTPTTLTVYAQDSACTANPIRTAVNISVNSIPTLSFNPTNPIICNGNSIFLNAMGAINYTWSGNLPNGSIQHINPTVTTIYTVTGSTAPGCSDTKTLALNVVPPPTITAISSGTFCVGETATISASGGTTYIWSNGQTNPTFTICPTSAGIYNYNVAGSNGVCNGYASATINAVAFPSITIISTPSIVCIGSTATITAVGANNYTWSNGSTSASIVATQITNSVFKVIGGNSGCISNASITIPLEAQPNILASASPSMLCVGASVTFSVSGANTYSWSNGSTVASFSTTALSGLSTYSVTGSDGTCTATSFVNVQGVFTPTIVANIHPTIVCVGATASVTVSGASSYLWSNGSSNSTFTISPLTAGQLSLNVTGYNSMCTANAQVSLLSVSAPTLLVAPTPTLLCAGNSATIVATGANTYLWNNGGIGNSITITPSTNFNLSIYGHNGYCGVASSFSFNVMPSPTVSIISDRPVMCFGESFTLQASGANSYTWNTGTNAPNLVLSPLFNTNYTVQGTNQYGCVNSAFYTQVVNLCLNLNEKMESLNSIQVYPNPTNDNFVIQSTVLKKNSVAQLLSIDGKLLISMPIIDELTTFNISHLAIGVYVLRISGSEYITKIVRN